jgi:hypothetical protein
MTLEQINFETHNLQLLAVRLLIVTIMLLAAALVMLIWMAFQASRQSHALANVYRLFEDWSMLISKDRREARKSAIQIGDLVHWFSQLAGVEIVQIIRKFDSPAAVDLMTADRTRLVVSPLKPSDLKSALGANRFKLIELFKRDQRLSVEPLLGRWEWRVRTFNRTSNNAGEFFDLEAAEVGNRLGLNWGEVNRLWFYVIPEKAK